jgi:hypothetical protein
MLLTGGVVIAAAVVAAIADFVRAYPWVWHLRR